MHFQLLKKRLVTSPISGHAEAKGEFILDSGASTYGIGGVLSQLQGGHERVIA